MPQALHNKLQELTTLAKQAKDLITKAAQQVENELENELATHIAKAKAALQEQANSAQSSLSSENAKAMQALQANLESTLGYQLTAIKNELTNEFKAKLQAQLEQIATRFETQALEMLGDKLQDPLAQQIAKSAQTQELLHQSAAQTTKEYLQDQDLGALIAYERFDSAAIAQQLAKDPSMTSLAKQSYAKSMEHYLASLDESSNILKALHDHAKTLYKQAMASDEILRDRYESKLRLLCFKIFGTQELVEEILTNSARLHANAQKPPVLTPIKNNILVAQ